MADSQRLRLEELQSRINPVSGALDTSFSGDGVLTQDVSGFATTGSQSLVLQADGKILSIGLATESNRNHPAIFRFASNGSPDTSFSGDGFAILDVPGGTGQFYSAAMQADGKIVASGTASIGGNYQALLARLNSDGSLDTSFSDDGFAFGDPSVVDDNGFAVAVQSDGKIVVGGSTQVQVGLSTTRMLAMRFNTDGTIDTTFGNSGVAKITFGATDPAAKAVMIQPDGKIVLAGTSSTSGGNFGYALARLNANGSLDTDFDSDGVVQTSPANQQFESIEDALLLPDGKILVAGVGAVGGSIRPTPVLLRYNSNGSLDTRFDGDGIVLTDLPNNGGAYEAVAIRSDGGIIAAGTISIPGGSQSVVAAYSADGVLDTSFGPADKVAIAGVVKTDLAPSDNDGFYGVAVQSDGKIVAAGTAGGGSIRSLSIARYADSAAPVSTDDSYSLDQDRELTVTAPGILSNDVLPSGLTTTITVTQQPAHGSLELHQDGSFVYTPDAGFHGNDSFKYQLDNGNPGNIATVSLTVSPPSTVPVSTEDSYSTDEDQALTVDAPGILANDQIPSGFTTTINIVDQPTHGTVELQQDGSFVYTPNTDYNGGDSFTYQLDNGQAGNVVTVSLTIHAVNDAPVTVKDEYVIPANGSLFVPANLGVLNNDTDVEGDPLTAILETPPTEGTLTLNADGSFNYEPPADLVGSVTFQYKANDGTEDGDIVTVSLTRNPKTQVSGTKLTVNGGDGADSVRLIPSGTTGIFVELISRSGVIRQTLRPATRNQKFTLIEVNLGAGNDYFDASTVAIPIRIIGGAGRDYIRTGTGADTVYGESTVAGGVGNDVILTGVGNDRIYAGDGDNLIDSGLGNDTVSAGNGDNHIDTNSGNDVIVVGNGDNRIDSGLGNDNVSIGDGFNAVYAGAGNDTVNGGSGQTFVDAGDGNDYVAFVGGQNTIEGGAGSDVLFGGSGEDVIDGESGNDLIAGGLGADLLSGGDGNDILVDGTVSLKNPTTDTFAKILATYNPAKPLVLSKITDQLIFTKDTASVDTLYGNAGLDWFWMDFATDINDMAGNEPLRG